MKFPGLEGTHFQKCYSWTPLLRVKEERDSLFYGERNRPSEEGKSGTSVTFRVETFTQQILRCHNLFK